MFRLVLAFMVAALWLPLLAVAVSPSFVESMAALVAALTVPLTLFVAVPTYWFFRRRVGLLACMTAGAAIGAIGCLLFWAATNTLAALNWAPLLLGAGLVSSLLFWFVGLWRNERLVWARTEARQ